MKSNYPLALSSLFCVGLLFLSLPAQAFRGGGGFGGGGRGDRANGTTDRSGTYYSLHHGSGTFNSSVTRDPGSTTGTTTWTNKNGGQGDHTFDNTYTKTGAGTATGTHEASTTYANGKTSSSQGSWVKTAPGDSTYTGTHTGTNGDVTDVSRTTTTSDGVRTVDSTYDNTTTGKVTDVDKTISTNANGSKQVDTTKTLPDDKTVTSNQTYTKTSDGYDKTGTVTGPNGNTSTDNKDVTFTKDANGDITRTATGSVTGPNGGTKLIGNTETWTKTYTPNPAPTSTIPPQD
jgi:hypothetical protein